MQLLPDLLQQPADQTLLTSIRQIVDSYPETRSAVQALFLRQITQSQLTEQGSDP